MKHFLVTIWWFWDYWVVDFDEAYTTKGFKLLLELWRLSWEWDSWQSFERKAEELNVSQDWIDWFNKAASLIEDEEVMKHNTARIYSISD